MKCRIGERRGHGNEGQFGSKHSNVCTCNSIDLPEARPGGSSGPSEERRRHTRSACRRCQQLQPMKGAALCVLTCDSMTVVACISSFAWSWAAVDRRPPRRLATRIARCHTGGASTCGPCHRVSFRRGPALSGGGVTSLEPPRSQPAGVRRRSRPALRSQRQSQPSSVDTPPPVRRGRYWSRRHPLPRPRTSSAGPSSRPSS